MKPISFLMIVIILLSYTFALNGQEYQKPQKPMKYWTAEENEAFWLNQKRLSLLKPLGAADRREGIASGNLIRTVFYNYGSIGKPNWEPSIEWPKGSGHGYAYEFGPIIGAEVEVVNDRGVTNTIHIVSDALIDGGDTAPRGKVWGWQPLPQYLNTSAETPAMSNNPDSWPQLQSTDNPFYNPDNTGPDDMFLWPGLDGLGKLSADLEAFWVMDDRDNDEFKYYPFEEDTLRRGLGLELTCRLLQFTASLAEDIIFYIVTVKNVSDKPLDKVVVGMFGDPHIGGPGDFSDDYAGFDQETNTVYSWDAEGSSNDYGISWNDLGWLGFKFLESPLGPDSTELGLTSMAGPLYATSFSDPSNDEMMWTQLTPDNFTNTIEQNQDNIFIFGSGYFSLDPGETQQFSIAILMGRGLDDLNANGEVAQDIYDRDYKFTKAPDLPKLTVVPDDGKAVLYWDSKAEDSFDDFFGTYDFEGYKIYRSTDGLTWGDPITDVNGAVRFYKPLAQFDIDNEISGFFPADQRLGTSFYLGENTGLSHYYVDENLINGITYYYAVTAYDSGYKHLGIQPAETGRENGVNLQSVMPTVRAAGYQDVPIEIIHDEGYATGIITATDLDPTIIGTNEYEIFFMDTSSLGKTYFIFYRDEMGDTVMLVDNSPYMSGEPNIFEGLIATLTDETTISVIDSLSGWDEGSESTLRIDISLDPNGIRIPRDMEIRFHDSIVDTSMFVNPKPIYFDVWFPTEEEKADVVFYDQNNDDIVNAGDRIVPLIWQNNAPKATWEVKFSAPAQGDTIDPSGGDNIIIIPSVPFETIDKYRITTEPAYVDKTQAKEDFMAKVAVVPNPYIVSSSYEVPPPTVFSQGRGDRRVDFINLPPKCTIRIFTTVGELVDIIEHNSDIWNDRESWDLLTSEGLEIAYGVYVYHIDAGEYGEKIDKFAIIK